MIYTEKSQCKAKSLERIFFNIFVGFERLLFKGKSRRRKETVRSNQICRKKNTLFTNTS
jgi:hypothetical protein